jgi:hypothetical protein
LLSLMAGRCGTAERRPRKPDSNAIEWERNELACD